MNKDELYQSSIDNNIYPDLLTMDIFKEIRELIDVFKYRYQKNAEFRKYGVK